MTTKKVIALLVVALFIATGLTVLATGTGETHSSAFPTATAEATLVENSIQPNPIMYGNVTWSSFQSNWTNPLTYQSGATINDTSVLPASLSDLYNNPITINPSDIAAPGVIQNNKIGTQYWNNTASWTSNTLAGGAISSIKTGTSNGLPDIQISINTSKTSANNLLEYINVPISALPSSNPAYDYITIISQLTGNPITGVNAGLYILSHNATGHVGTVFAGANISTNQVTDKTLTLPGQYNYESTSLAQLNTFTTGQKFNLTGQNEISSVTIEPSITLPISATNTTYTYTIYGMALTTIPITFGTEDIAGSSQIPNAMIGQSLNLTQLNPTFKYSAIENGGYSAAVTQAFNQSNNPTVNQAAINTNGYVEQVTYQSAGYKLPTASDLTYGTFAVMQTMNGIPGNQYIVANLGGVSYITQIQKLNGTTAMLYGAVANPNTNNTMILTVDYTAAQWNSVSAPPIWYSVAGVEYYWYVFLGVLLGLIGLGAGMKSRASTFRQVKK